MIDSVSDPKISRLKQFAALREQTHQEMTLELSNRLAQNPQPTEDEVLVGAFWEMIEPQVREAVFEFHRKGYTTASSGFGGEYGETQTLDGYFELDDQTKTALERLGAKILTNDLETAPGYHYTSIQFKPANPDLAEIKSLWNKIASTLSPQSTPAMPSISGGAEDFRKQYAPDRADIKKTVLERRLALEQYSPEVEQAMKQRLEELS